MTSHKCWTSITWSRVALLKDEAELDWSGQWSEPWAPGGSLGKAVIPKLCVFIEVLGSFGKLCSTIIVAYWQPFIIILGNFKYTHTHTYMFQHSFGFCIQFQHLCLGGYASHWNWGGLCEAPGCSLSVSYRKQTPVSKTIPEFQRTDLNSYSYRKGRDAIASDRQPRNNSPALGQVALLVKNSSANAIDSGDVGSIPQSGRLHGGGNQSWIFIGRTHAEAETPILCHLMWRTDSLEKTLMLGKTEDRRRRGWQRMRWLDGITDPTDMSLSKL